MTDSSATLRVDGLTVTVEGSGADDVRAFDTTGLPARFDAVTDGHNLRLTFAAPGVYLITTPAGTFKTALK